MHNTNPLITSENKEFFEGGRPAGGGAKPGERHDFVGLATQEFYKIKTFLQSSQIMSSICTTPSFEVKQQNERTIFQMNEKIMHDGLTVAMLRRAKEIFLEADRQHLMEWIG